MTMARSSSSSSSSNRRRCVVSFRATSTVQWVEPRTNLSTHERMSYWYTPQEIEDFHTQARDLCRTIRTTTTSSNAPAAAAAANITTTRGLELRQSLARRKRKHMTIQCVLMVQQRFRRCATTTTTGYKADSSQQRQQQQQLARLATSCSQWASHVARVQGKQDFIWAHLDHDDDDDDALVPALPPMTPFPLPLKQPHQQTSPLLLSSHTNRKRRPSCASAKSHAAERCVRQRTSTCY